MEAILIVALYVFISEVITNREEFKPSNIRRLKRIEKQKQEAKNE